MVKFRHTDGAVDRSRLLIRLANAALLLAVATTLMFWSVLTAPLSTVDEPAHVNSVLRVMQGGGWPAPQTARMLEGTLVALQEAGHPHRLSSRLESVPPRDERSVIAGMSDADSEAINWMTQHPPTYYAVTAAVLRGVGASEWRWDQLVAGARFVSIAMVVGGVALALATVRRVTKSEPATIVAGLALFTVPQFFNVLSLVTSDALTILAGSGMLYFSARALTTRDPSWRVGLADALGAGLFLGLGLLAKGTMLTAIPAVFLALLVGGAQVLGSSSWWRRLGPPLIALAVAFVIGGWWWLRSLLVFGELQSSNSGTGRNEVAFAGYDLVEFVRLVVAQLLHTFWGSIRSTLALPSTLIFILAVIFLAASVVAFVRSGARRVIALLAVMPLLTTGLIVFHAWEVYWNDGRIVGIQGRYLFPAIAVYMLVLGVAWQISIAQRRPSVRAASVGVVGVIALAAIAGASTFSFVARWHDLAGWTAMVEAGPFPASFVVATAGVAVAAIITACACGIRLAGDDRTKLRSEGSVG